MNSIPKDSDSFKQDELTASFDFCDRTGQKRGDCTCARCILAYGRIEEAVYRIPNQRQRTRRLTDWLEGEILCLSDALVNGTEAKR